MSHLASHPHRSGHSGALFSITEIGDTEFRYRRTGHAGIEFLDWDSSLCLKLSGSRRRSGTIAHGAGFSG